MSLPLESQMVWYYWDVSIPLWWNSRDALAKPPTVTAGLPGEDFREIGP